MRLVEGAKDIAEIVVIDKAVAVIVKGDTVQFNAEAFKLNKRQRIRGIVEDEYIRST